MKILTNENFKNVIDSNKLTLVDFWAEWCGPCKMLLPLMTELSEEMSDVVDICKCNVDDFSEIASLFNIRSIPTLIMFRNGEIIDTKTGASSKAVIKQWIESKI